MAIQLTPDDLLDLLVEQVGLPASARPPALEVTFADIGLDSLAFLQMQGVIDERYGVELPRDDPQAYPLASILDDLNARLAARETV
jgi:minimal PKS acyl carrier protein